MVSYKNTVLTTCAEDSQANEGSLPIGGGTVCQLQSKEQAGLLDAIDKRTSIPTSKSPKSSSVATNRAAKAPSWRLSLKCRSKRVLGRLQCLPRNLACDALLSTQSKDGEAERSDLEVTIPTGKAGPRRVQGPIQTRFSSPRSCGSDTGLPFRQTAD